jgi:hypothetical protein
MLDYPDVLTGDFVRQQLNEFVTKSFKPVDEPMRTPLFGQDKRKFVPSPGNIELSSPLMKYQELIVAIPTEQRVQLESYLLNQIYKSHRVLGFSATDAGLMVVRDCSVSKLELMANGEIASLSKLLAL